MLLKELLDEKGVLLADGATGTNLFELGLPAGHAPEDWNAAEPGKVKAHYRTFVDAGSDIILTNTFGGTRYRLKLHGLDSRVEELNRLGAELAQQVVAESGRRIVVAGSMGPTGELLVPLGSMTYEDCVDAFRDQARGLKAGGADVAWIETMSAPDEMRAAAEAAIAEGLPYVYTASFDTAGRTMMGLPPEMLAGVQNGLPQPAVAFGANCGVGASDLLLAVSGMPTDDHVVVAKANCGIPQVKGDKVEYTGTPELMAAYALLAADAGARIIGGCCGTTPEHVRAMRAALDGWKRGEKPELDEIVAQLGPLIAPPAAANDSGRPERPRRRRRA
ncbi:MAG: betaine--homocysteine S-methyltransferase [Minwuia sp.]|uniref:betaine--homocysteine S-methyltransferase n=1 Tax=Minwuia sp. TaxID=2493630 RepID=UPI003A88B3BA